MNIYVDGTLVKGFGRDAGTLADVLESLNDLLKDSERVVESVLLNDDPVPDWEENLDLPLERDAAIHINTLTIAQLLTETTRSVYEYLPRLQHGAEETASLLQQGRESEAFSIVADLIDGLQWYSEFLGNVSALRPVQTPRASERLEKLAGILEQIVAAWEGRDYTLLADLLEYELPPELESGLEYVKTMLPAASTQAGEGQ